jgi:hypothetical protein
MSDPPPDLEENYVRTVISGRESYGMVKDAKRLKAENERLKAENERLKKNLKNITSGFWKNLKRTKVNRIKYAANYFKIRETYLRVLRDATERYQTRKITDIEKGTPEWIKDIFMGSNEQHAVLIDMKDKQKVARLTGPEDRVFNGGLELLVNIMNEQDKEIKLLKERLKLWGI